MTNEIFFLAPCPDNVDMANLLNEIKSDAIGGKVDLYLRNYQFDFSITFADRKDYTAFMLKHGHKYRKLE